MKKCICGCGKTGPGDYRPGHDKIYLMAELTRLVTGSRRHRTTTLKIIERVHQLEANETYHRRRIIELKTLARRPCDVSEPSSRVCERGTKGCMIEHDPKALV